MIKSVYPTIGVIGFAPYGETLTQRKVIIYSLCYFLRGIGLNVDHGRNKFNIAKINEWAESIPK